MGAKILRAIIGGILLSTLFVGFEYFSKPILPEVAYMARQIRKDDTPNLPTRQNALIIPKIGVNAEISTDRAALDYGGWIQEVDKGGNPKVIAIHRYGLPNLTTQEQMRQTLYHVGKLEVGDDLEMVYSGITSKYAVTSVSKGVFLPEVSDYQLIIYTCNLFGDSTRLFLTLELVN